MPLVWIRDAAEESIYQQSLADPDKRFIVRETSCEVIYYLSGVKFGGMKKMKTIKEKGKPYRHPSEDLEIWERKSQLSFNFMHPYELHWLEVKYFVPDLSFMNKQLSLDI
jgi:hypothetical protein